MGLFIGVGVLVVALLGGGFVYMQKQKAEADRIAQEDAKAKEVAKAKEDARIREEAEKARLAAEKKMRDDAEIARKKLEEEMNQKLAAAEEARKQAEAARLANARGNVVIATEPAGANITFGPLSPRRSPATFTDVKIGKYPVTVSLPNHDEVKFEVEVNENATTEHPVVRLERITGTVEITSEPVGANYELRPAGTMIVAPEARRTGQTPATLADLTAGEYTVTITRDGWPTHTQNVTVARNGTAKVAWTFQNGVVKISTTPEGATVTRNNTRIGVTPLTLADQNPGDVRFELNLAGHEPATLSGRVESGKTLSLSIPLLSVDRLANLAELDVKPQPIKTVQPEVPSGLTVPPGRVEIELTVTKTGTTKDLKIIRGAGTEFAKFCLDAAAKWTFKPGMINGRPMNVRVVVPFVPSTGG